MIDPNFAALGLLQACDAAKSGGLACARGSEQNEEFLICTIVTATKNAIKILRKVVAAGEVEAPERLGKTTGPKGDSRN